MSLTTFYDFTGCTSSLISCVMYDSSDNSFVLPSLQIIGNDLVFGSYASDWASNNVRASVYLRCQDGVDTVDSNPFSLAKEFTA